MNTTMVVFSAIRQAALIVCATAGVAMATGAQTTHRLKVSAVGLVSGTTQSYRGTTQVTSSPTGINCRSELLGDAFPSGACTADFPAGTAVVLTATPLYDGTFDGWTGACAGQGLTCHLEMTADLETATRTIAKTYTLTVRGTGNARGQVRSIDRFALPPIACTIQGEMTSGPCVTEYPAGQMVWLGREEAANSAAQFIGWTGCGPLSDTSSCRMVMDGPKTVTAGWVAMEVTIESGGGNGTGTVTGNTTPRGLGTFNCTISGESANGACSEKWETVPPPLSITFAATPAGNSVFNGWSVECRDRPCQFPPPDPSTPNALVIPFQWNRVTLRAVFEAPNSTLEVLATGTGSGRVSWSPTRPDCVITGGVPGVDCGNLFPQGTVVTLIADPIGGSTFGGWGGVCSGTQPTCVVVVDAEKHVTPHFTAPRPAAQLARALLGSLTLPPDEQHQLDRFGNNDGVFNLGDLLALLGRTGERLSPAIMSALIQSQASDELRRDGRSQ